MLALIRLRTLRLDLRQDGQNLMATPIEFIVTFAVAFAFNLIPFAGPSNMLIASTAAIGLGSADIGTLITIGFLIALGAALAKGIQYMVTFFISGHLSQKRQARLNDDAHRIKRWAMPLLFLVAATPLPDEPVIIPLGLMRYNPAKFFTAYFLGKLVITIPGAFLGSYAGEVFSAYLSPVVMVTISVVLTIVITVILLKVDVGKLIDKYIHHKRNGQKEQQKPNNPAPPQ